MSIAFLTVALATIACDPGHDVTYENKTSTKVTVYVYGREDFQLGARKSKKYTVIKFSEGSMPVEARDEQGTLIYSDTFTWDELKAADWRISISNNEIPASPSPTPR
jgi:hypothetical protein